MIWADSYKEGFFTLNRNKTLIFITVLSVFFGKVIALMEQVTQLTVKDLLMQSINVEQLRALLHAVQSGKLEQILWGRLTLFNIQSPKAVTLLVSSVITCFLIAFFIDVGLAGLIKDLLVKNQYRKTQLASYGKFYFNPCFLFKCSVYVLTAGLLLMLTPLYWGVYRATSNWLTFSLISLFFSLPLAVVYTGFSSLGVKVIVVENQRKLSEIYHFTKTLMLSRKIEAALYFLIQLMMAVGSTVIAYLLMNSDISFFIRYSMVIFMLSYVTAFLKLCSFVFYLKISSFGG